MHPRPGSWLGNGSQAPSSTSSKASAPTADLVMAVAALYRPKYDDPRVLIMFRGELTRRQALLHINLPIPKGVRLLGLGWF